MNAFFHIYMITINGYLIEYGVKCPQWTNVSAKWSIHDHRQHYCHNQNCIFPYIQPSDCTTHSLIQQHQWQSPFQCSGRTDQLTEIWCSLSHDIGHKHWQDDDKYQKNHILQLSQYFIPTKRPNLFRKRDLIQQILNQSKWTQETTTQSSKQCSHKNQKSHYIISKFKVPASNNCLKRSNGTGTRRTWTGIAVQTRYTYIFHFSRIYFPGYKTRYM